MIYPAGALRTRSAALSARTLQNWYNQKYLISTIGLTKLLINRFQKPTIYSTFLDVPSQWAAPISIKLSIIRNGVMILTHEF